METIPNNKSGAGLIDAYTGLLKILDIKEALTSVSGKSEEMYYDMLGRPVGTHPTAPGMYVSKNKKVFIHK